LPPTKGEDGQETSRSSQGFEPPEEEEGLTIKSINKLIVSAAGRKQMKHDRFMRTAGRWRVWTGKDQECKAMGWRASELA
jgi:hypothetical protein